MEILLMGILGLLTRIWWLMEEHRERMQRQERW